jgi:hypothetical protein
MVERHPLGPRIFLFGVRWHDWHLGLLVLIGLAIGFAAGLVHDTLPACRSQKFIRVKFGGLASEGVAN